MRIKIRKNTLKHHNLFINSQNINFIYSFTLFIQNNQNNYKIDKNYIKLLKIDKIIKNRQNLHIYSFFY